MWLAALSALGSEETTTAVAVSAAARSNALAAERRLPDP